MKVFPVKAFSQNILSSVSISYYLGVYCMKMLMLVT